MNCQNKGTVNKKKNTFRQHAIGLRKPIFPADKKCPRIRHSGLAREFSHFVGEKRRRVGKVKKKKIKTCKSEDELEVPELDTLRACRAGAPGALRQEQPIAFSSGLRTARLRRRPAALEGCPPTRAGASR